MSLFDPEELRLRRMELDIRLIKQDLSFVRFTLNLIRHLETSEMATLDDIVADEATLKTANQQLIQLVGNAIAEITSLKATVSDPATQAKLDALHTALTADFNDVTTTLTNDGSAVDVPPPAPVPATGGATGN